MSLRSAAVALGSLLVLALTGCGSGAAGGGDPDRVDVVAGFYPLEFVADRVGGDSVAVTGVARPGAEPHDLELEPVQAARISEADLVVYLSGFQPAVDEAVEQEAGDRAFDVASAVPLLAPADGGHDHAGEDPSAHEGGEPAGREADHADEEHRDRDPHVWLDPTRLAAIGDALADRLAAVDPGGAAGYRARAADLRAALETLDEEYAHGLRTCQRREIVVSHAAFGYLADRYDLDQLAVSGLSPEEEPSPRRLAAAVEEARRHDATTIFFETLVSPRVAETIAREVGADTAVLDPVEGLEPGYDGDYLSLMRENLAVLRPALGCS